MPVTKKASSVVGGGGGAAKSESALRTGRVAPKIECMAWNANFTEVALGIGKGIVIFGASSDDKKQWTKSAELEDAHGLDISGLDWSPVNNKIVSASHDRNAYVWTRDALGKWKPTLAILRISRAALCCKWSPNGKKFAIGSGSKTVPVCQFDKEQDWWNSKIISKKRNSNVQHKSSIVAVAWHPNSQFLATACTDKKCRVWCAHFENHDGPLNLGDMADFLMEGTEEEVDFGTPIAEFDSQGWVHDCAFSPSGKQLAFVGHDATVTIVNFGESSGKGDSKPLQTVLPFKGLPFTSILFSAESQLVAAGYDFYPIRINASGNEWAFGESVDSMKEKEKKGGTAKSVFQNRDTLGQDTKVEALKTKHQAAIRCISFNAAANTLYSGGSDGRLMYWADM